MGEASDLEDDPKLRRKMKKLFKDLVVPYQVSLAEKRHSPFTKKLLNVQLNPYIISPIFAKPYAGRDDLVVHVCHYDNQMEMVYASEAYICRYFEQTLTELAAYLFNKLKPNSTSSWDRLSEIFCNHFLGSTPASYVSRQLHEIVQEADESLRSYIHRFNEVCISTDDLDFSMAKEALIRGTRNDRLRMEIITRRPKDTTQMILPRIFH